jgi:N-methylhydantoinase B
LAIDEEGTAAARALMAAEVSDDPPFFDRGPGYARLAGGRGFAEVDRL